jgi:hypothetical protein
MSFLSAKLVANQSSKYELVQASEAVGFFFQSSGSALNPRFHDSSHKYLLFAYYEVCYLENRLGTTLRDPLPQPENWGISFGS